MSILAQLIASIFKSEPSGDPFYADTYAILNLQGANNSTVITDDAANPATYTTFGGATLKTDQFIFGSSSLYCDGVDDYVERNTLLTSPTNTWTIEGWFRPDENSTTFGNFGGLLIFTNGNSGNPGGNIRGMGYYNPSVNDFRTVWGGYDDNGDNMVKLNINLIANTWYYYIVTSNQSANTFTFSVSEAGGPLQTVSTSYATNNKTLTFRYLGKASVNRFKGYIGPTRVTLNVARPHVVPTDLFYTPPIIPSQTFAYTGYLESFTVPSGVTSLNVNMWGAGGGSGGDSGGGSNSRGGAGGFLKFTSAVTPGEILTAQVGGGGLKGAAGDQVRKPGTGGGMTSLVRGDPFYSDVALLLHMNGTNGDTIFTDSSSNPKTLTVNGTVQTSTDQSKFGGSSLRTGTSPNNSRLTVSATGLRLTHTAAWTIDFWVRFDSTNAGQYFLAASYNASQGNIWFYTSSNGTLNIHYFGNDFGTSASILPNTWYFVSMSHNGTGTLKFYVDGALISSKNITSGQIADTGWDIGSGDTSIVGSVSSPRVWIDDFRVTLGVDRYPVAFTPPTAEFPDPQDQYFDNNSLLLHMNGSNDSTTFTDNSQSPKTLTAVGASTITTLQKKFGTGSLSVPSSSDGITTSGLNLDTNFTIEGWVKPAISGSEKFMIIQGVNLTNGFLISLTTSEIRWRSNGTTDISAAISKSDWYHFAIVRNGSATNNVKVYVDGVQVVQGTYTNTIESAAGNLNIGACGAISSGFASYGYIDEFRITNGVARYTANFNPPTSAFANSNGIVAIVGAGGGGGGIGQNNQYSWGGSGGDTTANPGGDALSPTFATGGGAGTQTAGGTAGTPGTGLNGSYLQGGAGAGYSLGTQASGGWPNGGNAVIIDERGGGGGGGYYGGGGGGGAGTHGAGGGGGSSYTGTGVTAITHAKATQNTVTAPGNTETGYVAGVAVGGQNFVDGGNGLIYIGWTAPTGIVARYWRINVTANNGSLYVSVGEMFLVNDGVDLDTSGKVYTASADIGSTYGPAGAFNGNINTSTYWGASASVTQWLQIDMGTEVVVDQIDIGMSTSANPAESPRDFSFQYSNDGTTWTVAKTFTNQTSWTLGARRTFSIYP